jgi:hypothetical protein
LQCASAGRQEKSLRECPGGTPTNYTVAVTSPGVTNLAAFDVGIQTQARTVTTIVFDSGLLAAELTATVTMYVPGGTPWKTALVCRRRPANAACASPAGLVSCRMALWIPLGRPLIRSSVAVLAVLLLGPAQPLTAAGPRSDDGQLYILPMFLKFSRVSNAAFEAQVATLRERFPEGGPIRVGFSTYLSISMGQWDITTEAEARANLTSTIENLDRIIARARAHNLPIALALVTAVRGSTDPAQRASQDEDRRNMQWYDDNTLATGWWSYSRYARRQVRVRDLYLRALARVLANRIARYPETIVGVAGDGEPELASIASGPPYADYSPFAIAEFRDWLRAEGLYAPGAPYFADAYEHAANYHGDATPADLNVDMGTAFESWDLRYFDWSLDDDDLTKAIPASVYKAPGWNRLPDAGDGRFDPPRKHDDPRTTWVEAFFKFRQNLVRHYAIDFARVMTTHADPETGMTIPPSRWFSYLIPADYLFERSPGNPDWRFLTSASSWRSADIRPYGGAGITAFNTRYEDRYYRTLANVAPLIGALGTRWGIFEWNPSVPPTDDPAIYRHDISFVEAYRPHIVAPYAWDDPPYPILNTGFEHALREMIARMRTAPWRLQATSDNGRVRVTWAPPDVGPAPDSYTLVVGSSRGDGDIIAFPVTALSTVLDAGAPYGVYYMRVHASTGGVLSAASNEVELGVEGLTIPNAPTDLVAVSSGTSMTFNWIAPRVGVRPTSFVLEAGSGPGLANLASLSLTAATTFTVSNVPPGTYHVRVRAATGAGTGAASNDVVVTSGSGTGHCTPVDVPGPLTFRPLGSQILFEWDEPVHGGPPIGYRLEAGTAAGLSDIASVTLGATRTFTVLAPPGTYFLQLRAIGACGTSAPGPVVRLTL